MIKEFTYSVAIRTLGTAGERYLSTLKSIQSQTIQPQKIIVYIAEGYNVPKETIEVEQYIYVKKGMISQRALPYNEIETDYILFLDDDLYFPPDMVEKLYDSLHTFNADCISPNIYPNHNNTILRKIIYSWAAFTFPMKDKKWAFRVRNNASYSYNNNPQKEVYFSQTAAGACSLWKVSVYKNIHFEDEIFFDMFKYALGDDMLFYYKLYINGYKLLIHYNTGIVHLDARTGKNSNIKERSVSAGKIDFIIWHRTCYNLTNNTVFKKILCILSFLAKVFSKLSYKLLIQTLRGYPLDGYFYLKGIYQGFNFTQTQDYNKIRNYKLK